MTKKELTSVYYIKKEIKMWEEQLELIESKAEGKAMQITGLPFTPGTGSSDQMADLAIKAVSVRELIEPLICGAWSKRYNSNKPACTRTGQAER